MDCTKIFADFHKRRAIFDEYLKTHGIKRCTCPSCGYPTIGDRECCDRCFICDWHDDGQDDDTADVVRGGPNECLTLTDSRHWIGMQLQYLEKSRCGTINMSPEEVWEIIKRSDEECSAAISWSKADLQQIRGRLLYSLIKKH